MLRLPTESLDSLGRHCALQSGGGFQLHAARRPDGRGLFQCPARHLFFQQLTKGAASVPQNKREKCAGRRDKQQIFSKD